MPHTNLTALHSSIYSIAVEWDSFCHGLGAAMVKNGIDIESMGHYSSIDINHPFQGLQKLQPEMEPCTLKKT